MENGLKLDLFNKSYDLGLGRMVLVQNSNCHSYRKLDHLHN